MYMKNQTLYSGIETGIGEFLSHLKTPALHHLPVSRHSLCSQSLSGFLESYGAAAETSECPTDTQIQSHTSLQASSITILEAMSNDYAAP